MKILVTGAKGQLGKKIIEKLAPKFELVLTDTDNMDITDKSAIRTVLKKEKPEFIIHGAAYTNVEGAEENIELCRRINAEGTKNLAEIATENNITLLYISTDFVFDGENSRKKIAGGKGMEIVNSEEPITDTQQSTPYTELDKPNPLSIYGLTKFEGEEFIRNICDKYYITRIAWLFGELPEGHPGTNFVESMLKLAASRDSINVVNDQIGSPTYTGDLVEVFGKIIEQQPPYGTYHFSGEGACSWYDFAKEIFSQTNTKINLEPIASKDFPQKAKRPPYSYLDKTKIEETLNIKVRPWQEMLSEYLSKR